MTENWISTTFSKDSKMGIILIIIVFNVLSILTIFRLMGEGGTTAARLLNIGLVGFFQAIGWGLPLAMYLLSSLKVSISSYSEIKVMNRLRKMKIYTREQIHKVHLWQEPMTKQWIYVINHNKEKPLYGFDLDLHAGKAVWDWYYNEGEWKQEEMK